MLKRKNNLDESNINNSEGYNNMTNDNDKNLQQVSERIDNLEQETSQLSQSVEDLFTYQIEQLQKYAFNFCPNCGAKIIDVEEDDSYV